MLTSAGDLALAGTVGLEVAQWRGPAAGSCWSGVYVPLYWSFSWYGVFASVRLW
jgi:hypothetical protein